MGIIKQCRDSGLKIVKIKKTLPIYLIECHLSKYNKEFSGLNLNHGWGNGYVAIPKIHSLYGLHYEDLYNKGFDIEVNGGITFSDYDDELDKWIFGFDTLHSFNNSSHDFEFVKSEAIKLRNFLFQDKIYQRFIKIKNLKNKINGK